MYFTNEQLTIIVKLLKESISSENKTLEEIESFKTLLEKFETAQKICGVIFGNVPRMLNS